MRDRRRRRRARFSATRTCGQGIAALLDSAEADLSTPEDGGPLPVNLPPGFNAANVAGPSGTPGTFAGFNRALAAYAKLQYAYAATRSRAVAHLPPRRRRGRRSCPRSPRRIRRSMRRSCTTRRALTPADGGRLQRPARRVPLLQRRVGRSRQPGDFAVGQTTTVFVLDTVAPKSRLAVTCGPPSSLSTVDRRIRGRSHRQRRGGEQHDRRLLPVGV